MAKRRNLNYNSNLSALSAQVLVITLLAIFLVSILAVAIFNLATRDLQQTLVNQDYQRLYNASEGNVFRLIDKYGRSTVPLSQLTSDFGGTCLVAQLNVNYNCNFTSGSIQTRMNILETPNVQNFEIGKDETLDLNVANYRGDVTFSWTGTSALEFNLIYTLGANSFVISDFFDLNGVFDSNGGNPLSNPLNNHAYDFIQVNAQGEYRFRVGTITGLPPAGVPQVLRISVRRPTVGTIYLNVRGEATFPNQIRRFTASSFDTQNDANVAASVITQIPLLSQAFSVFDYSLLTNSTVLKDPVTF